MKLKEYLQSKGIKINFFSKKSRVSLSTVYHVIQGRIPRYEIALLIKRATDGEVDMTKEVEKKILSKINNHFRNVKEMVKK